MNKVEMSFYPRRYRHLMNPTKRALVKDFLQQYDYYLEDLSSKGIFLNSLPFARMKNLDAKLDWDRGKYNSQIYVRRRRTAQYKARVREVGIRFSGEL